MQIRDHAIVPSLYWTLVPGFFDFEDIYDEAVANAKDGAVFVELGTFMGKSALYMAQKIKESGKKINFYCVDKWEPWPDVLFNEGTHHSALIKRYGSLFNVFQHYLKNSTLEQYIQVVQSDTVEAASLLGDVDFVFIDADHSFNAVCADIDAWKHKVVAGGVMAGHDYTAKWIPTDVAKAVQSKFNTIEERGNSWLVRL